VVALGDADEDEALALAAALERRSEHPLAYAILSAAGERREVLPAVTGFRSFPGRGATGRISDKPYLIGSPRLFAERDISLENAAAALEEVERAGETPVVLRHKGGEPTAVFGLADAVRSDARKTVQALRKAWIGEIVMLTGDAEAPARRVAEAVGVDYRARLLPEQ
jgi:Cd2+/Zn2+-exporting ATPase